MGRYFGKNTRSRIIVNDVDFGWIDLRNFVRTICLPITALLTNQIVELQLFHEFPERLAEDGMPADDGQVSFGIEKFGFQFSKPE